MFRLHPLFVGCLLCAAPVAFSAPASGATIADRGDFVAVYPEPKTSARRAIARAMKEAKVMDEFAAGLNDMLALPFDVSIGFEELGQANAFYNPNKRSVRIGFELVEDLHTLFSKTSKDPEVVLKRTINATLFVMSHELAHALIDVYDVPVVGREEDAADSLSAILLNDRKGGDNDLILDGAQSLLLLANRDEKTLSQMALWDDHSLSKQRFYNILSLVYGSNPTKYAYLVSRKILPKARATGSRDEYARTWKAWSRLLAPCIK